MAQGVRTAGNGLNPKILFGDMAVCWTGLKRLLDDWVRAGLWQFFIAQIIRLHNTPLTLI
jgi:hypothetical protein